MATAKEITAKENVYKNIRNALIDKMDNPFYGVDQDASVYNLLKESNDVTFAQSLQRFPVNLSIAKALMTLEKN